jgi:N-acetylneuraminic acid mutarotase
MRTRSLIDTSLLLVVLACRDDTRSPTEPVTTTATLIPKAAVTSNTWVIRANMPSDRWFVATATFPTGIGAASLYAIGGSNSNTLPYAPLGKVQLYNPATDTWTTKASLPHVVVGYGNNGAVVIQGLIYVPGGMHHATSDSYLQVYNPVTNRWVDKAPMPPVPPYGESGLASGVSGAINGKLYVLGSCFQNGQDCGHAFERYDPALDTWTLLPIAPLVPFRGAAAGVLNGKFCVEEGGALEVYDPTTNKWTLKSPMPNSRTSSAFASVNNNLYVVGGFTGTTQVGRVDMYNPATNTWSKEASVPRDERGLSGGRVVLNGQARLELVGGARPSNNLQYIP